MVVAKLSFRLLAQKTINTQRQRLWAEAAFSDCNSVGLETRTEPRRGSAETLPFLEELAEQMYLFSCTAVAIGVFSFRRMFAEA